MTPLSIEIEGIRSFTTSRTVEFGGLELFAIVGDTGAGKSSILEAMIYALFNGTSWDGKNVKELMSTGATRMKVRFRFILGERMYTVTRITPREGTSVHVLECDGLADEKREGERAVTARISELLGVNRDQFIKTVVLPQGEFAALLTLQAAPRAALLTSVLGLGIIDVMAQRLGSVRARAKALCATWQGRRGTFPSDPAGALREAADQVALRTAEERALHKALEEIGTAEAGLATLLQRAERRAGLNAAIAAIAPDVAALRRLQDTEDALQEQFDRNAAERADAQAKLSEAAEAIARAKAKGADADSIGGLQQTLVRLVGQCAERRYETAELENRTREADSIETALADQKASLVEATARREAAANAADAAQKEAAAAAKALQVAEKAWDDFARAQATAIEAAKEQAASALQLAETAVAAAATKRAEDQAEEDLAKTRTALYEAERANAAAHAAHGLSAGDSCPVCLRALPAGFQLPRAADLDRAKHEVTEAEALHREASRAHTRAEAQIKHAQDAVAKAEAKARDCGLALDHARANAEAAGVGTAGEADDALAGIRERMHRLEAERVAASDALSTAAGATSKAETLFATTRARLADAQADIARRTEAISRRSAEIDSLRRQIPTTYLSEATELTEESLSRVGEQLEAAAELARALTIAHTDALRSVGKAIERDRVLDERRQQEIDRPLAERRARLAMARDALSAAGYSMPLEAAEGRPLIRALAWGDSLMQASADVAHVLATEEAEEHAAAAIAKAKIAECLAACAIDTVEGLRAKWQAALVAVGRATSAHDAVKQGVAEAAALDAQLSQFEPFVHTLDALHRHLGDSKFKKFVTDRKQDKLLGVATSILRRMTNERYGFGPEMKIVDRSASQPRSPDTLSGGEKFLASLALALALVEIAKRSGRNFGALFLDEGFGSLDPQALDEALTELERQAESGRMIGVITHIDGVMEYIDNVLRVVRTSTGSDVIREGGDDLVA
jgi:exonuclease SbcC